MLEDIEVLDMAPAALIFTIGVIALGIADLILVIRHKVTGSISQFVVNLGFKAPFVVFAHGVVAGHLFGYMSIAKCVEATPLSGVPLWKLVSAMAVGISFWEIAKTILKRVSRKGIAP